MNTNIVEIKVKNQSIIRSRPLYQWDSGQILKVIDQDIPDNTEVQFGSACLQPSVSAFMANNQVKIPQAAMEQPMEITAYMVIVEPDSETTVKEIRIPIRPKPKHSDYVPEEDVPSIMQVIQGKADKSGWTPNKYLGTDAEGNMVEKEAPSGGETTVPTKLSDLGSDSLHRTVTDEEKAAWNAKSNFSGSYNDLTEKPTIPTVPTDISAFNNDKGYLTGETDPTVPTWAKASEKPTYTAEEVGARPNTWIPSASDVGADPYGTAAASVSSHNTAEDAHADIRLLVEGIANRMNALADCDDETLDQWSELVAYIKANRSLIEQITTCKVSVTDIINNLTTNVSNKPLSAAQGVVLKGLIDAMQTAVNAAAKATDLTSHTGNTTVHITAAERTKWNQAVTDVGTLSEEIVNYLPKNQGSTNVGKILVVGADGNLTLTDMPDGSSGDVIGTLDENGNIIITGNLADGTYVFKYENTNGTYADIGSLVVGGVVQYSITATLTECTAVSGNAEIISDGETVTLKYVAKDGYALTDTVTVSGASYTWDSTTGTLVLSEPTSDVTIAITATKSGVTNIIDTIGYEDNKRLSSSGVTKDLEGYVTTGMIDTSAYSGTATIRTKGVDFNYSESCYIVLYDSNGTKISYNTLQSVITSGTAYSGFTITADTDGNLTITRSENALKYFRINGYGSGANLIVTINEEIPN